MHLNLLRVGFLSYETREHIHKVTNAQMDMKVQWNFKLLDIMDKYFNGI